MSSTNLDMPSDEDYRSESEFYYPNETENYNEKENISSYMTKNIKVLNSQGAKVYFNTTSRKHSEENRLRLKQLEKVFS